MVAPGMQILVVEDDPDIRLTLEQDLGDAGYVVCATGTASDALRVASASRAELVRLDLMMARRAGIRLAPPRCSARGAGGVAAWGRVIAGRSSGPRRGSTHVIPATHSFLPRINPQETHAQHHEGNIGRVPERTAHVAVLSPKNSQEE